jgi:hypothetical protein
MAGPGPQPDFASRHATTVAATAERCYRCLEEVDIGRSLPMRLLLAVRGIGRLRTLQSARQIGFVVLDEDPPHRMVLGLVGRPWRPSGGLQRLSDTEFHAFDRPGFVKVVWAFQFEPVAGGCAVSTSTDIFATDDVARRRFRRYWRVVGPFSGLLRRSMLRSIKDCA